MLSLFRCCLFFVGACIVACGGKVVFDGVPGAGGASATNASSSTTTVSTGGGSSIVASVTTSGPAPAAVTSTGSGPPPPAGLCMQTCAVEQAANCQVGGGCQTECADLFAEDLCVAEMTAYMTCVDGAQTDNFCKGALMLPADCESDFLGFLACASADVFCQTKNCTMSEDGDCICEGFCLNEMTRVDCQSGICACYVNNLLVGTCLGDQCDDIGQTCCGPLFALPH